MTQTVPISPTVFADWLPFAKAAGFFLGTFVLEDVAAVGAGLLLASGGISWPAAFIACFLGIWTGDAGLYALARSLGRGWFERSSLRRFADKVTRSERWFAERGTPILIFSRLIPGARLPTYLAAGFLRVPVGRFLFVTGAASCVWTVFVLSLTQMVGGRLIGYLAAYRHAGLLLAGVGVAVIVILQFIRVISLKCDFRRAQVWVARWGHWEFWPPWLFYAPVTIYYLWLGLKYRGLGLPTAANPGIFAGGIVGESKMATLRDLVLTSPDFTAEAALIEGDYPESRLQSLHRIRADYKLDYPFILKPDVGQRGAGVKLIRTAEQAELVLRQTSAPMVVQRYAAGPREAGIFYHRLPDQKNGRIFAITEKVFPVLTGDGKSTLTELIWRDPRARFMAEKYLQRFNAQRKRVPEEGEELKLVEAGNHAQGCIFRDGMKLCTPELEARIDEISQKVSGFFIGRYDIRYAEEAELRAGRNFQIIELNGAASEATSIYDARNSLFAAYRTLFQQWDLVFAIGAANRRLGCVPTPLGVVWRTWREYARVAASYPMAD